MDNRKELSEIRAQRFKTEEEAQAIADEVNKLTMGETFCPMIKENCRTDCQCFVRAYVGQQIYSHTADHFRHFMVKGFYCDNAMFYHNE
jgi:hypothetical protein